MTEELAKAIESIGRYLAARDHSELELKNKLSRRYSEEIVDQALRIAVERNWLVEPARLAERVAEELSRKRKSSRYIQDQLRRRGLPAVERDSELELEKIRRLMSGKFDSNLSYEDKVKAYRFLKYRGFENALIRKVLHEKLDE
jgi:regulatory protein